MDSTLKVTDQSEEIAFDDMVGGDQIINIPLFQRSYKWTDKNLKEYWEDIASIVDETSYSQFLGVLVLVPQARKVGQPFLLDVVDGQQRLSTCYLTALALVLVAADKEKHEWAIEAVRSYLITRRFSTIQTNTKLIPSAVDRQQFARIWDLIKNINEIKDAEWNGNEPTPPSPSGPNDGKMWKAFKKLRRMSEKAYDEGGFERIEQIFDIVIRKLSFVTINLRSPTAAPAIFERLNARGERINISDLVRNEIFARVANDPMRAQNIFDSSWEPFINTFRDNGLEFEKILFPYGLTLNNNITKSELFQALRSNWGENSTPQDIINEMKKYSPILFALEAGNIEGISATQTGLMLLKMYRLGAPSSIHPFVFQLVDAVENDNIDENKSVEILSLIESFLVRRAIVGIEPTGLHAVFKGLWEEAGGIEITIEKVKESIAKRSTVPWPNNNQFKDAIINNPLYGKRVAPYAISEYEKSLEAETPIDQFEIEHIYPRNPDKNWNIKQNDNAKAYTDVWGNLIPLSEKMNPKVSNSVYEKKCESYYNSKFPSARQIQSIYPDWNLETIKNRGAEIAEWAVDRWPHSKV